jgi:hypothetical protein
MKGEDIFNDAAKYNLWHDPHSKSGPGSNLTQTCIIREEIPKLLKKYNISSMVDAPCGDFFWIREIIPEMTKTLDTYLGIDIAKELIKENTNRYTQDKVKFLQLDIIKQLIPKVDLVMTRDCFIHLSYRNIYKVLVNYKNSGAKYILLSTYTKPERRNYDCADFFLHGRVLNMQKFPFFLDTPEFIINEGCTEWDGAYSDKSLALWELNKINLTKISLNLKLAYILTPLAQIENKLKRIIYLK